MRRLALFFSIALLGGVLVWATSFRAAEASVYWAGTDSNVPLIEGVLGRDISICFVGTAVTNRPNRIAEILEVISDFEDVANIHFQTISGLPVATALDSNINALKCPANTGSPGGNHYYMGDIRILIPGTGFSFGTGPVWGQGCPMQSQDNGASWANEPWLLDDNRSCLYNMRLGDDGDSKGVPWRNHTLHEFGHSLGLAHEHQRNDANAGCTESDYGTGIINGYLTPYDRDSVMHYKFDSCSINGNYDHTGLSPWDKLALHIMYPEDNRVAEFVGTTVIQEGEMLSLQSAWQARGANINFAASNFLWEIDGQQYTDPTLNINLGIGEYVLEFSYQDLLGRDYYYSGPVRVLDTDAFYAEVVAPVVTNLPNMYPNYYYDPDANLLMKPDPKVTFFFPQGLFGSNVVVDYARQPALDVGMPSIGLFYDLDASDLTNGDPAEILPGQMYSVTITYDETAVPFYINESELALYYKNGNQWIREESSQVNTATNHLTATPNHFSSWAILAPNHIYLPFVKR